MSRKQEIFQTVLTNPYNHDSFVGFVREFLNSIEIVAPNRYIEVKSNFSFYVDGYYHIGNYMSDNGEKIAVISVCLNRGDTVERARGMQRNFVKPLIEQGGCAGALVAFFTKDEPNKWRLSFIRMDYEFSKGKVTEKLTPAKRYSYLVGKGEPCHTAQSRLYPIFSNDENNPGIDELEEAFSVEKVTKEFFDLYSEKYHQLREYLESNEEFMMEAEIRKFTSEQFAKKLLGQIVFLYFVQKKGWLGVEAIPVSMTERAYKNAFFAKGSKSREIMPKVYRQQADGNYRIEVEELQKLSNEDEEILASIVKGKPWGSGPKDFMRKIFDGCNKAGKNYFDDYLEPLFYTGLNKNRGENGFYAPLHRRIPFLNGGLFEQLDNYEWQYNNFAIPNEIFSNVDTKGREADGILDIFDRYNFTMNEDEPMEREVAIDPEMLGKIFENLLDVKDRKSKGAFYTPREIVHYMCQETLINYLVTKMEVPEQDIRDFILYGDLMRDEDTTKTAREGNQDMFISEKIFDLKTGVNRLKEMDDFLATVRVADLAVGSGAFPLGMLNEIVRARENLSAYMSIGMNAFQKKTFYAYDRKPYDLKVNTIKNCIYACDIEPSAVDIAKLRLWLSIVIDDEIADDTGNGEFDAHTKPRQLPNLDCNIICGNSLIDEFKGNKLISESELLHNVADGSQQSLFQSGVDTLLNELIVLQDKLFFVKEHEEKEDIKQNIQRVYDEIILEQIQGNPDLIEDYYQATQESSQPFILWQLYFPRVFRDNGGFDIIIGNPPYVDSEEMTKSMPEERELYARKFHCAKGNWDLYIPFWEKGFNLLNQKGNIALITPNKWLAIKYGATLRDYLFQHIYNVSDYSEFYAFESADVSTVVVMAKKQRCADIEVVKFDDVYSKVKNDHVCKELIKPFDNISLCLSNNFDTLYKLISNMRLEEMFDVSGAATVSETYEIAKLLENIEDVDGEEYFKFINTGTIDKFESQWGKEEMTYVKEKYLFPVVNKKVLKDAFPRRYQQATTPKLITTGIRYFEVYGDFKGDYLAAKSTEIITSKDTMSIKALLPLLNSNVVFFFLKEAYGGLAMGGGITFSPDNLSKIPLPNLSSEDIVQLEKLSDSYSNGFGEDEQNELDNIVYQLYDLNDAEIRVIEEFKVKTRRKR